MTKLTNHAVMTSDQEIIEFFHSIGLEKPDNPREVELARLRDNIDPSGMISLYWLRNRIVHLRKCGELKVGVPLPSRG